MAGIKHAPVIIAAVIWFGIGAGWYTVLASPWLVGIGKTMDQLTREHGGSQLPMVTGFIAILVMCYALAWILRRIGGLSLIAGATTGAAIALGFIGTMLALNYGFEGRSVTLWMINTGYALVGMVIAGAIIGAWPKGKGA